MHAQWRNTFLFVAPLIVTVAIGLTAAAAQDVPATRQNVPPTARQAATLPQFAAKLARTAQGTTAVNASRLPSPGRARASGKPASACAPTRGGWLPQDVIYQNGPINGTTDAWTINFGYVVADTFAVTTGQATVSGLTFAGWTFPGDVLQSVEISITSDPLGGGTSYFDGVVNFTQSNCSGNQYGFYVCTETAAPFSGPALSNGTYWVNLQNAVVNDGDPLYWDENSGRSMAVNNSVGTIPSEAFTILGDTSLPPPTNSCMPEQVGSFKVIRDFSGADGNNPSGVALDPAGNVYGTVASTVYKMAQAGSGWVISNLYRFDGGDGNNPTDVFVGDNGILYGSACGYYGGCGYIFSLRPAPAVCRATSCSWIQNVVYDFPGDLDTSSGGVTAEKEGNLYGTGTGGAHQAGAVFELSPSIGGWVGSILYSFSGGSDGAYPSVIVGRDGNLYGLTSAGGAYGAGVVFQLSPGANGWTESVLYNFAYDLFGTNPRFLVQDSAGDLLGITDYSVPNGYYYNFLSRVFVLRPSKGQWTYEVVTHTPESGFDSAQFTNLTIDAQDNLYITGQASANGCINPVSYGYIIEAQRQDDGWWDYFRQYWSYTYFPTSGNLAVDSQGNLYGTTSGCGAHNSGTVWQSSP